MFTDILIETVFIPIAVQLIISIFYYFIVIRKDRDVYQKTYSLTLAQKEEKEQKVRRWMIFYFLSFAIGIGVFSCSASLLRSLYYQTQNELFQVILVPNITSYSIIFGFMIAVPISIFINNFRKRWIGDYYKKPSFSISKIFAYLFLILSISFTFQIIRKGVYFEKDYVIVKDLFSDDISIPLNQVSSINQENSIVTLLLKNGLDISINDIEVDYKKLLKSEEMIGLNNK
ncbi:hypothetical protein [Flammeovirga sp. SubArs3]|uniref:hypothetical protein n=1 Tax=Flammeovirga sp. SubArs3 TaxID=2995316 RepID=UPI00248C6542|nr:hypothetical protein [Flammeovirga sp. SubArs3]